MKFPQSQLILQQSDLSLTLSPFSSNFKDSAITSPTLIIKDISPSLGQVINNFNATRSINSSFLNNLLTGSRDSDLSIFGRSLFCLPQVLLLYPGKKVIFSPNLMFNNSVNEPSSPRCYRIIWSGELIITGNTKLKLLFNFLLWIHSTQSHPQAGKLLEVRHYVLSLLFLGLLFLLLVK